MRIEFFSSGPLRICAIAWAASLPICSPAAHGQDTPLNASDLEGQWVLVRASGRSVPADPPIYFRVEDGILSGYDGCNRFGGPVEGGIRTGGRGCPGKGATLPLDLDQPAEHLARATRDGDKLILPLADGSVAEFVREGD